MPNIRTCRVSFTDVEGITHTAQVAAASLYEAAALGIAEFRRCGLMEILPGPATRLSPSKAPATVHELPMRKLSHWLEGSGRSPVEQVVKVKAAGDAWTLIAIGFVNMMNVAARVTIKTINDELAHRGHRALIAKGGGYFFFIPEKRRTGWAYGESTDAQRRMQWITSGSPIRAESFRGRRSLYDKPLDVPQSAGLARTTSGPRAPGERGTSHSYDILSRREWVE